MENEPKQVIDALVLQSNGAFRSYIHEQNMWNILQCGGLTQYSEVALLDTDDRPVDEGVKDGTNPIYDVLILKSVLEPNIALYLS